MKDQIIIFLLLAAFVSAAAVHDMATRKIPNKLIVIGWTLAVASQTLFGDSGVIQNILLGTATGFALLFPFYAVKGMAAGDVKMMMVVGAFAGPAITFQIVLATFIFGGIGAVAIVLYRGKLVAALDNMRIILMTYLMQAAQPANKSTIPDNVSFRSTGRMPYGPAIAVATITVVVLQ